MTSTSASSKRTPRMPATEAQRKALAKRVEKLRASGTPWPEIVKATNGKVPGSITGRKLLREYGSANAASLIRPSYDRKKAAAKRAKVAKATSRRSRERAIESARGK